MLACMQRHVRCVGDDQRGGGSRGGGTLGGGAGANLLDGERGVANCGDGCGESEDAGGLVGVLGDLAGVLALRELQVERGQLAVTGGEGQLLRGDGLAGGVRDGVRARANGDTQDVCGGPALRVVGDDGELVGARRGRAEGDVEAEVAVALLHRGHADHLAQDAGNHAQGIGVTVGHALLIVVRDGLWRPWAIPFVRVCAHEKKTGQEGGGGRGSARACWGGMLPDSTNSVIVAADAGRGLRQLERTNPWGFCACASSVFCTCKHVRCMACGV